MKEEKRRRKSKAVGGKGRCLRGRGGRKRKAVKHEKLRELGKEKEEDLEEGKERRRKKMEREKEFGKKTEVREKREISLGTKEGRSEGRNSKYREKEKWRCVRNGGRKGEK